jgi:hypothetical protein
MVAGRVLTVQAGATQAVIKMDEKEVAAASRFASQIMVAASADATFEAQRPTALPAAEKRLAEAVGDTTAIAAARAGLAAAEANPGLVAAIESANVALTVVMADTAAVAAANEQVTAQDRMAVEPVVSAPPPTWLPRASNAGLAILGIVVVSVVFGGAGSALTAPAPSAPAVALVSQATPTAAPSRVTAAPSTPVATTAAPTPTSAPTPKPKPTPVLAPDESNVKVALQAHERDFIPSNFDNMLLVVPDPTFVSVTVKPNAVFNEADVIRIGSADALDLSEAIFGSGQFPTVTLIHLEVHLDFTNSFGQTTTDSAGWLEFSASTASRFDYAGMRDKTSDVAWCDADSYFILAPIWKALNSGDKGCIKVPTYP